MTLKLLSGACAAAVLAAAGSVAAQTATEPPRDGPLLRSQPPSAPHRDPVLPEGAQVLPAPDSPPGVGADRTDLGRDCARARSRVQQTICKNGDLVAMDRDVARFAGGLPGGADQGAWVAQLESCEAGATTVYDGPIYDCLRARYERRLVQLSRMAGGRLAGTYRLTGRPGNGSMTVVEGPQPGRASVHFTMVTAEGARACGTRIDTQVSEGAIEGRPAGLPGCRVAIQLDRGRANVQSNGCAALCEMGQRVDGDYLSLGAVAPAARPSAVPPASRP
ncbi:MAG: hypothetical protein JNM29_11655 [Candidatus Odyssella sp.]|nr:hypothetical protein [Candidatus Odyssella sp.]